MGDTDIRLIIPFDEPHHLSEHIPLIPFRLRKQSLVTAGLQNSFPLTAILSGGHLAREGMAEKRCDASCGAKVDRALIGQRICQVVNGLHVLDVQLLAIGVDHLL